MIDDRFGDGERRRDFPRRHSRELREKHIELFLRTDAAGERQRMRRFEVAEKGIGTARGDFVLDFLQRVASSRTGEPQVTSRDELEIGRASCRERV